MPNLLAQLRTQIRDVRYALKSITIGVSAAAQMDNGQALLELTQGHLILTVLGNNTHKIPRFDFDLSMPKYATVGALYEVLSRIPTLAVMLEGDANREHPTLDLEPFGPTDINAIGLTLMHRLFSDSELDTILLRATHRHNPSMNTTTLPESEGVFVLQLAQAEVCRQQAIDAAKRRGVSMDVGDLRALASDLEKNYADDTQRLRRAIVSPREAAPNQTGEGEIVIGAMVRKSLRYGQQTPYSQNLPPNPAALRDIPQEDIGDEMIHVRWERSRDTDFGRYELWMDSTPNVQRAGGAPQAQVGGRRPHIFQGTAPSQIPRDLVYGSGTTSRLAFSTHDGFKRAWGLYTTDIRPGGVVRHGAVIDGLEPSTQYYFRLYTLDQNGEAVASEVLGAQTRALRVRFAPEVRLLTMPVAPGQQVVLQFDPKRGPFNQNCSVRIGDKAVPPVSFTATTAVITMPEFVHDGPKAVVVVSPTGLVDQLPHLLNYANPS